MSPMFAEGIRASRASVLLPILSVSDEVDAALGRAERTWLGPLPEHQRDQYFRSLVLYYDLTRRAQWPVAWERVFRLSKETIERAVEVDQFWTQSVLENVPTAVSGALTSLEVMTKIGDSTETSGSHITAKILCDSYLDLFEGLLAPLGRVLIPLREVQSPTRPTPQILASASGREIYERLAAGRAWKGALSPFDPFYRNGIAHRSQSIDSAGTVTIHPFDGQDDPRFLSWDHLVALVTGAISVLHSLLASVELHPSRRLEKYPIDSLEAREMFGFYVAFLGQEVDEWETDVPGFLSPTLRGHRCDEAKLLAAILPTLGHLDATPQSLFIRYRNADGQDRGYWSLSEETLAAAEAGVQSLEEIVSQSKSYQLRLPKIHK